MKKSIAGRLRHMAEYISFMSHMNMYRDCNWKCELGHYVSLPFWSLSELLHPSEGDG